jgi:hypothetical protein
MELIMGKEGKWKKTVTAQALKMVELQQGGLENKHIDLRLECSDIRAAAQHISLDALLFLSNTIPFGGMLPCRW